MVNAIRGQKSLIVTILAVLCCLFIALPVFAGEGDGSGGGKDIPLSLATSNPANGQNNVAINTDINLTFNKNVVNLAVKDNNMKCFTLAANGNIVPIQVNMPDDQVDFEHRRNIDINPLQDLKPGTMYKLVISGQLQAKNGMTMGSPVSVSFTTAGTSPNTNIGQDKNKYNTNLDSAGSNQQQTSNTAEVTAKQTANGDTKAAAQSSKPKTETKSIQVKSQKERETKKVNTTGISIAAGLVIIAAGGYGYYRYTCKK